MKKLFTLFAGMILIFSVFLLFYSAYKVVIDKDKAKDKEEVYILSEVEKNKINNEIKKIQPNKEELLHYTTHLAGPYHQITSEFDGIWEEEWQRAHNNMLESESIKPLRELRGVAKDNDILFQQLDEIYLVGLSVESMTLIEKFLKEMKEAIKHQKRVINEALSIYNKGSITEDDYIYLLDISDKRDEAYLRAKTSFNQFKQKNGIE